MSIPEATRISHVSEYYFSKKLKEIDEMKKNGSSIINLGIGSPDIAPPSGVIEELMHTAAHPNNHGYQSYRGIPELRQSISQWSSKMYDITLDPEHEILPLMGSKEGIMHISQAFVNANDQILIPNPGYPTYGAVGKIVQANVLSYTVSQDGIDLSEIKALINARTKIIWINFPHMPTGLSPDKAQLKQLIDLAIEHNCILVNDNPYSTILTQHHFSIFQIPGAKNVCLELNSLSKTYNMAGWRIGWISGNRTLINSVLKVKSNMDSGMFLPVQYAAIRALQTDQTWLNELNKTYSTRREIVWEILDLLGATFNKLQTGLFVWAQIPDHMESAEKLVDELLKQASVFITPGFIFGSEGHRYVRISLCSSIETLSIAHKRISNLKTLIR